MSIIELFNDKINGVFSTFDRMIIKGYLRPFFNLSGRMYYLSQENVLLKDFGKYAEKITEDIKNNSKQLAAQSNRPHIYLNSSRKSKELTGKSEWERIMIKKRRKTLVVCENCHKSIHNEHMELA